MSVYIKIKESHHLENPTKAVLLISSSDNTLKAEPQSLTNTLIWNTSFISSSKEKKIVFEIKNEIENKSFGKGELYFSSLRSHPEKQISCTHKNILESITLDNSGKLAIDVYYTEKQNFIGEIAFYNYDKGSLKASDGNNVVVETTKAESRQLFESQKEVKAAPKSSGLFFCCGDEGDDKQFTVEEDLSQPIMKPNSPFSKQLHSPLHPSPTQAVQFYKGPCKSTNLFSCCDAGLQDQKFTVVEDYYRDK